MTDYERGIEQASAIYQEVIREYVAENNELRKLVQDMWRDGMCECDERCSGCSPCKYHFPDRMREIGVLPCV